MPFHSYRRPPSSIPSQRATRPRFTLRHRPEPELPAPVVMLGAVTYRDRDGMWWTVREEQPKSGGPQLLPCLVFASAGRLIRVDQYPSGWRSLSTAGLVVLSSAD